MVMGFSDPRFLPVDMIAVPHNCSDYQVASLSLPESLGDVYASVQWYILFLQRGLSATLTFFRQCEGEFTTSCSVHKIIGGCNDPEAFAHARQAMKMRVNCQNYKEHEKRDVGSRNLLLSLHLGNASSD